MIKNLIIKTNNWYDNLNELPRFIFFLFVIMGSFIVAMISMQEYNFIWALPTWFLIFCLWRVSYVFIR